jgi:hypothetical protein
MAILGSIKYQLLILYNVNYIQNCDIDPMKWERRSEHKGLLDINTIKNGGNIQVQNTVIFLIYGLSKTNAIKQTSTTKKTATVRNKQHSTAQPFITESLNVSPMWLSP